MSEQPAASKSKPQPSERGSLDEADVNQLDRRFSQDAQQLAHLERTSTLKAIVADQAALIDADRQQSPRASPAPPQLQRMEHSFSEEELKKLDSKAQKKGDIDTTTKEDLNQASTSAKKND